ncbi:polysaccharide biosynthesis protein [Chryseobacterium wangxinyae]|uniref:polysaccharide biosynthesis protein n=1 Tax=Chryseobacterium sp. CY350 TaxID=2997336 RepID=UPI002270D97E|nr:polysaccharide biosynthesis protein [Chryseobacterium sp. CY350]MCY0977113.1 polysaccharide biosynthesis protein [Chryseobacterium sp. CY350]WBZ97110.1 polysaccharide biosynthesis protein [Chryseobacterium sp. CY350]
MEIRKFFRTIGLDSALFFTLLFRGLQAVGTIFTIFFIATFLNKEEQGYYYTFGSILAIQVFFELGITAIITQFVAHEMGSISLYNYDIKVDTKAGSRLSSLLKFCVKWFFCISLLLFVTLIIVGFFFFNNFSNAQSIDWHIPWIILCLSTVINLFYTPILAFIEGLGFVATSSKIRAIQQLIVIFASILLLFSGMGLYANPFALLISAFVPPSFILFSKLNPMLLKVWRNKIIHKVDYIREIFPLQWKIALSWASGYFIYQLFNPIIFATEGAVIAGKVGISLAFINGILTISLSWMNIRIPQFSKLIAQSKFYELDVVFKKNFMLANIFSFTGLLVAILFIAYLNYYNMEIENRFLSFIPFSILAISAFVNQFIGGLAIYLRCHKKEPLLIYSLAIAIVTASFFLILGKKGGLMGVVWSYFFITFFISLPWVVYTFISKRKLWHKAC